MNQFLNPQKTLSELSLKKNMVAADFGAGSGGWAIPLAKMLEDGKVFAIDIMEEPLSALKSKITLEKILNLQTIKTDVEKSVSIPSWSCDLVLMTNLLFEVSDKKKVLEEGKRILTQEGRILVIDWKKDVTLGPTEGRISSEEIKKTAKEAGLKIKKEFDVSPYHWALILVK
ncbi:class I SAM-dependent methyltransferase [Patescibacteria group bacterium]